jgi:hypothetical protein
MDDATDDLSFLGAVGLRTEILFPRGRQIYGLEPGFQVSGNAGSANPSDAVVNPFLSLTARHTLGRRIGGFLPDIGAFFDAGYNFQTFELTSIRAQDEVNVNLEAGLDFGFSRGRPKIWLFRVPRFRVGYRFGDLEGLRIRIGGDWLTTVAEQHAAEARD